MRRENYELLDTRDAVKFVVGTEDDLAFMERCADEVGLWDRCSVLASPVWGAIEPAEIAAYLIDHGLDRARLQLQLHKIIWPDETRGLAASSLSGAPKARSRRIWKERSTTQTTKLWCCSSGGVDSTTLLARAVSKYGAENVYALSISYGQKHAREIEAARTVAAHYGVQQRFSIWAPSSPTATARFWIIPMRRSPVQLRRRAAGRGATAGPVEHLTPFPQRALPFRGCLHGPFPRLFAGLLRRPPRRLGRQCLSRLLAGVRGGHESRHRGGHWRRSFALEAPFVTWSKADIVREGLALGETHELTWSCQRRGALRSLRRPGLDRAAAAATASKTRRGSAYLRDLVSVVKHVCLKADALTERPSRRVPILTVVIGVPPLVGGFSFIRARTATIKVAAPIRTWTKASISLICITPFPS